MFLTPCWRRQPSSSGRSWPGRFPVDQKGRTLDLWYFNCKLVLQWQEEDSVHSVTVILTNQKTILVVLLDVDRVIIITGFCLVYSLREVYLLRRTRNLSELNLTCQHSCSLELRTFSFHTGCCRDQCQGCS